MRVIGVDPGLQKTGYALVEKKGSGYSIAACGVLVTEKTSIDKRLLSIYGGLVDIIDRHAPACLSVETGFYSKNVDSLVKMSQVKGIVILAAALKNIEVFEYSPKVVKNAITGRGNATKEQVKFMVEQLLGEKVEGSFDISDAIAVAICHLHRV